MTAPIQTGPPFNTPTRSFFPRAQFFPTIDPTLAMVAPDAGAGAFLFYNGSALTAFDSNGVVPIGEGPGVFNIANFGAIPGQNADAAIAAALAAMNAFGGGVLAIPGGDYIVTTTINIGTLDAIVGAGWQKSRLIFRPTANDTLIFISDGASRAERSMVRDITLYSDDLVFEKIALDVSDVSGCLIENVQVAGTGVGTVSAPFWMGGAGGSIALRTNGREVSQFRNLRLFAERPIDIAANPNTAATDGEDCDHFNFRDLYLVADAFPCIAVAAGLGVMETTFDGFQAWVGGTAGYVMNDTRAAPVVPSRGLAFHNIRREQSGSAVGYMVDCIVTQDAVFDITLINCLADATGQGVNVDGYQHATLVANVCATAAAANALRFVSPAAGATLTKIGCLESPGSVVTLTGLSVVAIFGHEVGTTQGPSDAHYAATRAATIVQTARLEALSAAGVIGLLVGSGAGSDVYQVITQAAGSGASRRAMNTASSDFEPMADTFETLEWRARTGVGTSARVGGILSTGRLSTARPLYLAQDTSAEQTSCGLFAGVGAPNNANGANGDIYFRSDGGALTTMYQRRAGAWVGIV